MHEQRKQSVPPFEAETLAYKIRNSLYLNITNRCTNVCIFCPKFKEYKLYGNEARMSSMIKAVFLCMKFHLSGM